MKFADRLIALRKEKHLTQAEIAKVLNLSRSTYSGWAIEGKEPDVETLCILADLFGVSCDYLLGYSDDRTHSDTVLADDRDGFLSHYKSLPPVLRESVAKTFDSFYLLLDHDMQSCCPERLKLYQSMLGDLQRLRAQIRHRVENGHMDAASVSELMTLQSDLKNSISTLLDELLQADLELSYKAANNSEK